MEIIPKPKNVSLEKLNLLSDAELNERITKSAGKVAQKKEKYLSTHALNMARASAYESYRKADVLACQKILAERRMKSELPKGEGALKGNAQVGKVG